MQNIILWMPNTVLMLDQNEPLTPSNFSIIPISCLSNTSRGKNDLPGSWHGPLHSLFSLSQLSSYVMHNLRRPQDSSQCPLPTNKISASTSSPGFAGFVMNSQNSPCLMLDEDESHSPPQDPWDAEHHKSRAGPGLRASASLGLEGFWLSSHL